MNRFVIVLSVANGAILFPLMTHVAFECRESLLLLATKCTLCFLKVLTVTKRAFSYKGNVQSRNFRMYSYICKLRYNINCTFLMNIINQRARSIAVNGCEVSYQPATRTM